MATLEEQERFTRVAVEVFQTQNPRAILMLKDFLTVIPSPTSVRIILTTAITDLLDISPTVVCWLLENPEYLQPEVEVTNIVTQKLLERLTGLGFTQNRDFILQKNRILRVSEAAKLALSSHSQFFKIQSPLVIIDYFQSR